MDKTVWVPIDVLIAAAEELKEIEKCPFAKSCTAFRPVMRNYGIGVYRESRDERQLEFKIGDKTL